MSEDPQSVARQTADAMWAGDHTSQALGIEILAVGPGTATLTMQLRPDMLNGHGNAHGGILFTLADSTFAYACNSYGQTAVAAHCSISFIRPGRLASRLVAVAREISRAGRSGIYDVQVSDEDGVIAEFRGHSRIVGGNATPTHTAASETA